MSQVSSVVNIDTPSQFLFNLKGLKVNDEPLSFRANDLRELKRVVHEAGLIIKESASRMLYEHIINEKDLTYEVRGVE